MNATKQHTNSMEKVVPLYKRNIPKSEVIAAKSKSSERNIRSKPPSTSSTTNTLSTSSLNHIIDESKKKKSYVNLFHAKIGYIQGSRPTDTTRAVCEADNFETARSFVQDTESVMSFVSDTSSFYKKFIDNEQKIIDELNSVSYRSGRSTSVSGSQTNTSTNESKSKAMNNSTCKLSATTLHSKISKGPRPEISLLKVPTLGGLGHDQQASKEKFDRFKKQQLYGQRASNQNRMRIMESKVVKNFKYELQKSSELNKSSKDVLG